MVDNRWSCEQAMDAEGVTLLLRDDDYFISALFRWGNLDLSARTTPRARVLCRYSPANPWRRRVQ